MFISTLVHDSLLDAGAQLVDSGDGSVDLLVASSSTPTRLQVKRWTSPIRPSTVQRLAADGRVDTSYLLLAPSFSAETRRAIENVRWSWIAEPALHAAYGHLVLADGGTLLIGQDPEQGGTVRPGSTRGRTPWLRFAIMRHLLLRSEWTQARLAVVCQVTQARVSQVLHELQGEGFVGAFAGSGRARTWTVGDVRGLTDRWLSTYPGPGGAVPTYWYGLDAVADQARAVVGHLAGRLGEPGTSSMPVVSGDAAADYIAPYRRSQVAVIYTPAGADLSVLGLTPAPAGQATIKLVVPQDKSVWPYPDDDPRDALLLNAPFALADPLQVAWDLLETGRPDADQAAAAVTKALFRLRAARR